MDVGQVGVGYLGFAHEGGVRCIPIAGVIVHRREVITLEVIPPFTLETALHLGFLTASC